MNSEKSNSPDNPKSRWISPQEVVATALSLIDENGYVYKKTTDNLGNNVSHPIPPCQIKNPSSLEPTTYARELGIIAREVHRHCVLRINEPHSEEFKKNLWGLANYLTSFRNNPDFLNDAIQLIKQDQEGRWNLPSWQITEYTYRPNPNRILNNN